jgi:ubiquinone/menaquinone biosynthesis C-methylase UbiE
VEASHNFGDYQSFFREVHRILRPGGVFLYCDYASPDGVRDIEKEMRETALNGTFHDITNHIAKACRLDTERRRNLIHNCLPWYFRMFVSSYLANYAAIDGTRKFKSFHTLRERYFMTCAIRI